MSVLMRGLRVVVLRLVLLLLGVRVLLLEGLYTLRVILRELEASVELERPAVVRELLLEGR